MPSGIRTVLDQATPFQIAVAVPYAIALAAVSAEVMWRSRSDRRILRTARTGAVMMAGAVIVGLVYTSVFRVLWEAVAELRVEPAAALWRAHPIVGGIAAFIAWDASGWLYHVIGHRTRVGWAAHSPHHSGEGFDITLGLRQSWAPFHGLLHHPLLALAGFDFETIVVCSAIANCWQVLEHTSAPVHLPRWLSRHVMTPGAHRRHHALDGDLVNVGPVFTWWDRATGTWVAPEDSTPVILRAAGAAPTGAIGIELAGWRDLLSRRVA
jgi:sterol desaturase/sphingolipid hydroxylase (fatty acid hydroxylase superfamily)